MTWKNLKQRSLADALNVEHAAPTTPTELDGVNCFNGRLLGCYYCCCVLPPSLNCVSAFNLGKRTYSYNVLRVKQTIYESSRKYSSRLHTNVHLQR
jgi:hypothetical protein